MLLVYLPQYLIIYFKSSVHLCHYCTSSVRTNLFLICFVKSACLKQISWLHCYLSLPLYGERCLACLSDIFPFTFDALSVILLFAKISTPAVNFPLKMEREKVTDKWIDKVLQTLLLSVVRAGWRNWLHLIIRQTIMQNFQKRESSQPAAPNIRKRLNN